MEKTCKFPEENKEIIKVPVNEFDAAAGCVIGAFCGDAIGAPLEFRKCPIDKKLVSDAMEFTGKGSPDILFGQITDDSELALCLAHGIINMSDPQKVFEVKQIVIKYGEWMRSKPFDAGITVQNALIEADTKDPDPELLRLKAIRLIESESNGSLMRISPLGVYVSKVEDVKKIEEIVRSEASLTHANDTVQEASVCYCIAIKELIVNWNKEDRRQIAFNKAKEWANKRSIDEWFILKKEELPDGTPNMGYAKIAFSHAFYYLKNNYGYSAAIEEMLIKGGDTDTNAAIVGGLIGAAEGFPNIPAHMKEKMLKCESHDKGYKRPVWLCPMNCDLLGMIRKIFDNRPISAEVTDK